MLRLFNSPVYISGVYVEVTNFVEDPFSIVYALSLTTSKT